MTPSGVLGTTWASPVSDRERRRLLGTQHVPSESLGPLPVFPAPSVVPPVCVCHRIYHASMVMIGWEFLPSLESEFLTGRTLPCWFLASPAQCLGQAGTPCVLAGCLASCPVSPPGLEPCIHLLGVLWGWKIQKGCFLLLELPAPACAGRPAVSQAAGPGVCALATWARLGSGPQTSGTPPCAAEDVAGLVRAFTSEVQLCTSLRGARYYLLGLLGRFRGDRETEHNLTPGS